MALPKKKRAYYKNLLSKKLETAGVVDQTIMGVSKLRPIPNPNFDPEKPEANDNQKLIHIPSLQAQNLHKQMIRKLLDSSTEAQVKAFLEREFSVAPVQDENQLLMEVPNVDSNEKV
jgi:hypothetical protein